MTDDKKPESDVTIVVQKPEAARDGAHESGEAAGDSNLRTTVAGAGDKKPDPAPEAGAPPEAVPRRAAENAVKREPATEKAGESRPLPAAGRKEEPARKGSGVRLFLIVTFLLILGAGAYVAMQPGSDWLRLFPFMPGADRQSQTARTSAPQGSMSYEWVQTGMPMQLVRDMLGEPLQIRADGRSTVWEYDTGAGVFLVTFQDGNVSYRGLTSYPATRVERSAQENAPQSTATYPQKTQSAPAASPWTGPGFTTSGAGAVSRQEPASPGYDRIRLGMSPGEVSKILGEPVQVKQVGKAVEWEYDTGTGYFEVRFNRDSVVFKDHVAYHKPKTAQASPTTTVPQSLPADVPASQFSVPPPQTVALPSTAPVTGAAAGFAGASSRQDLASPGYDQIRLGMSPDEVSRILGEPAEVKPVGTAIEWEYDTGKGYFEVRFQRNSVVFKDMVPYHKGKTAQSAPPPGVVPDPAAFERIKTGMTRDAVTRILGKPTLVKQLRTSIEWEYETPQGVFEVRFRKNRVAFAGMAPSEGSLGAAPPSMNVPQAPLPVSSGLGTN
ncbi:MAG: outer membrane protein assembly factor BamE [Desulfobacteraceae bacterium]|nr:outer membrane protein assembly factor BamE [Desulfobacteraceae bacterium]